MTTTSAGLTAGIVQRSRLRARIKQATENQLQSLVQGLARAMEAHDPYTSGHGKKMIRLAEETARRLGLSGEALQHIRWAALLHDIGKISIPSDVLRKSGPLTVVEWELMRKHPQVGCEIVQIIPELADVAALVRLHHEKYDGSGYPDGLAGEDIPLGARILSVVDAYSAMTDARVYRPACTSQEAVQELRRCAGTHFDPVIVEVFLNFLEMDI